MFGISSYNYFISIFLHFCSRLLSAAIVQWKQNGGLSQQFIIVDRGDGMVSLHPREADSKCLEVSGSLTTDGARVHLQSFKAANNMNQLFRLKRAVLDDNSRTLILPQHVAGKALEINQQSKSDGTEIDA